MLKEKKLEYQKSLEEYCEEQKLYEIFEQMMKSLITNQPADPIEHMIQKLETPEIKRIVLVRPPGSRGKEIALSLAEYLSENGNFTCISVGDLVDKEISKRSAFGKEIEQSRQTYSYVKDEIVIELVSTLVKQMEKEQKSYIIEGFPRTEIQAIALMQMGVIPDKFILLSQDDKFSEQKLVNNLGSEDAIVKCKDKNKTVRLAKAAIRENNVHMASVKNVCNGFITELDGMKNEQNILEEIVRVLKLKSTKAPRRAQRVILMGTIGSETEKQALQVCEKYNLVYVQVSQLLKDAIRREGDTQLAHDLATRMQINEPLPDDIIIDLVRERLNRADCRINGWILEGCPINTYQIKQLRDLQIIPQVVVAFELSDQVIFDRISQHRYDPSTGVTYHSSKQISNLESQIRQRLVQRPEDKQVVVEKRLNEYRDFLVAAETEFSKYLIRINAEDTNDRIFLNFCDALGKSV